MLDRRHFDRNFTKFLVDKQGKVLRLYGSMASPESLSADIEGALK
jgi:glutathione peroxidase-family protein